MKQSRTVSALLGLCFAFGLGCGSGADVASDDVLSRDDSALEQHGEEGVEQDVDQSLGETDVDALETAGDIGSVEQAIIMPVVEPGGTGQQCVAACTRFSTTDLTGVCCVCNGAVKKFARGPTASTYLCK